MKWKHFILLQGLIILAIGAVFYIHKDKVAILKYPPESLADWYKPTNKRQVWLHNMFKLRREMQAVEYYSQMKNQPELEKWADRLGKHYLKISEMVPEWESKLDQDALSVLQESVQKSEFADIERALDQINTTCNSCHRDYRVVTAVMYRAPDFSALNIAPKTSYKEYMKKLIKQVNQIKISIEDGKRDIAISSLKELKQGMRATGETCSSCHDKDQRMYPNELINNTISRLENSLLTGTPKEQGKELGTLAVQACAQCHGTHRLSGDTRRILNDPPGWLELIKH